MAYPDLCGYPHYCNGKCSDCVGEEGAGGGGDQAGGGGEGGALQQHEQDGALQDHQPG